MTTDASETTSTEHQAVKDPVCGMDVDPETAEYSCAHDGATYYFCGKGCREKFAEDPEHYLSGEHRKQKEADRETAKAGKGKGRIYTCPMHPDVEQEGPGSCPKCGMDLEPKEVSLEEEEEPDPMTPRFWGSLALTVPVFVISMSEMVPGQPLQDLVSKDVLIWVQLVLTTPVVFWGGSIFIARAWRSIATMNLNMFTLIAMGTLVAYFYSLVATIAPGIFPPAFRNEEGNVGVYFEAAAVITTLVLLGQMLEVRARRRTSSAVRELLSLAPRTAHMIDEHGEEQDISLEDVEEGMKLRVRPGEKVPVDGQIIEGSSAIDESMVTGEPIPTDKKEEDKVIGGTLNQSGAFVMKAEHVGEDTMLSQIVRMVSEAQRTRAPIENLVDKVAAVFVPSVIGAAILTFIVWAIIGPDPRFAYAIVAAVSVLIIACPCALGLATPMSIMVSTGRGATAGILVRNAEAIQAFRQVDTLIVDKTGTLTEGKPKLVTVEPAGERSEETFLSIIASLEQSSEHPLARAIVDAAKERGVKLKDSRDFESRTGRGVTGKVDDHEIGLGNTKLLDQLDVDPGDLAERAEDLRGEGQTVMLAAIDGEPAGLIGVADPIKETTNEALRILRDDEGLRVIMATGDSETTAKAVAGELDIDDYRPEVTPEDKAALVKELQDEGRKVAMAGDGINDAPALAAAYVGIAMGSGTEIAMESAGITLVKGDLRGIAKARRLSHGTMTNIKQNLVLAFGYNTIAIPVAAGVLYPVFGVLLSPMIAAAAMTFSSVSVIGNALRLRRAEL